MKMALVDIDGDPWSRDDEAIFGLLYEACDKLCCDIAESLTLRDNEQRTSQRYSSLSSSIYVRLKQLSSEVASLKTRLLSASSRYAMLEEAERRSRLVEKLESRSIQLQQRYNKRPDDENRSQLMLSGGTSSSQQTDSGWNREDMDSVDIDEIRKKQKAMIQEQDEGLESLAQIISRQKEIARTIGTETELHNEIIDDLAEGIDRATTGLISETRSVRFISRKDSTCGYWIVILILFVAILVVALV